MKFENCKYDHIQLAAQFISMAEKFMPFVRDESYRLNMMEPQVRKHHCGTVACHGGYGLLALGCDISRGFRRGADAIAEHLGFGGELDLEAFAIFNPDIWGNERGTMMFYNGEAFGVHEDEVVTMGHIVAHYLSVAERLLEIKS